MAAHLPLTLPSLHTLQRGDYPGGWSGWYLLNFLKCQGCRLYGGGTIDGQGRAWVDCYIPGDRKLVRNFEDPSCSKPEECRSVGHLVGNLTHKTCVQDAQCLLYTASEGLLKMVDLRRLYSHKALVYGAAFATALNPTPLCCCRPRLVGVTVSEDVEISGVSLVDPIYWSLHILRSRRTTVRDVNITSDWDIANTDGELGWVL